MADRKRSNTARRLLPLSTAIVRALSLSTAMVRALPLSTAIVCALPPSTSMVRALSPSTAKVRALPPSTAMVRASAADPISVGGAIVGHCKLIQILLIVHIKVSFSNFSCVPVYRAYVFFLGVFVP